MKILQEQFSY